ncbi:MAG TPA: hypothetical protein DCE41_36935 [Cytophagales bacterium]|nr:hypothetical protein [Cytophagales bacterium]
MQEVKYHHISSFASNEGRVSFRKPITIELAFSSDYVVAHCTPLGIKAKGPNAEEAINQLECDLAVMYEGVVTQSFTNNPKRVRSKGEKLFAMIGSVDF